MNICKILSLNREDKTVKFMLDNDMIICGCGICNLSRNICIMTGIITIEALKKEKDN